MQRANFRRNATNMDINTSHPHCGWLLYIYDSYICIKAQLLQLAEAAFY